MMFGGVLRDHNSQYLTVGGRLGEVVKEAGLSCSLLPFSWRNPSFNSATTHVGLAGIERRGSCRIRENGEGLDPFHVHLACAPLNRVGPFKGA